MLFIHNAVSLCNHCYRHIPAVVFEDNNKILMKKQCPEHGVMGSIVEIDTEFYYSLQNIRKPFVNEILLDVTDKCQLECPHCYHLPDNKTTDRPLSQIIEQLQSWPRDVRPHFAGAEPALRQDFIELIRATKDLNFANFSALTNGLRFADREFAQQCFDAGLKTLCIGINHHSYQGKKIHTKQLQGLKNVLDIGYQVDFIGYTVESLDHLPDILEEIQQIKHPNIAIFKVRCGSFIGRSSDQHRSYLSTTVSRVKQLLEGMSGPTSPSQSLRRSQLRMENNLQVLDNFDNNLYHFTLQWNDVTLRLIQWPDVTNIDLEELNNGGWAQFYDGPVTNFVHQVITRDAYVNMSLPKLDLPPVKYQYKKDQDDSVREYWKTNWSGPVPFDKFEFVWPSDPPGKIKKYFQIQWVQKLFSKPFAVNSVV